jgi:hypothetical protein
MKGTQRPWPTFMQGDLVHFGVGQYLFYDSFGHTLQGPEWYVI